MIRMVSSKNKDIFAFLKEIKNVSRKKKITNSDIESIGMSIETFNNEIFIPVEYAELILSSIGKIIDGKKNAQRDFSTSFIFLNALVNIIESFKRVVKVEKDLKYNISSFSSHHSYELVLYIILSLIESTQNLKSVLKTLKQKFVQKLIGILNEILLRDFAYLTQV